MSRDFLQAYSEQLAYSIDQIKDCEHEPLASCGAIQAAGFYLTLDSSASQVLAVSANLPALLEFSADEILNQPAQLIFSMADGQSLDHLAREDFRKKNQLQIQGKTRSGSILVFDAHFHPDGQNHGVDLELLDPSEPSGKKSNVALHSLMSRLEQSSDLEADCQLVCDAVRDVAGFERAMIYRFQENWDGEVIAEAKAQGLSPYLHLRYPAHDIPAQAREMYLKTDFRMIVDARALAIPVLTRKGLNPSELGLSLSTMRASSPIHIEYLMNMGVRSSFSMPLKVHGRLWGLLSCHHYSGPRHLSSDLRSSLQIMCRILSGRVSNSIENRRILAKKNALEFTQTFVSNLTSGMATKESFMASRDKLLSLIQSTGAYIRIQGEEVRLGSCPTQDIIEQIIEKAQLTTSFGIWKSSNIRQALNLPETPLEAAGALVVPFSFGFEEVVIWFRVEAQQEVHWGGKPQTYQPNMRLEPRASFEAWLQLLRDHSFPWTEENEETAQFLLFHFIKGIFSKAAALSQANKELERVTRAKDEFIGMVSHELRTPLSAIIGWLDILRDTVPMGNPEVKEAIEVIDRNAKLQVTLINDLLDISRIISGKMRLHLKPHVAISHVAREVVDSLRPMALSREINLSYLSDGEVEASGDPDRLRQIVWNLVTNAVKFTPQSGRVSVITRKRENSYTIQVSDSGIGLDEENLSHIFDRFSQVGGGVASRGGLGLGLSIVKSLCELHGGSVKAESEGIGRGSRFTVEMPIFAIEPSKKSSVPSQLLNTDVKSPGLLNGKRVLVAEDQPDTASALIFTLKRLGAECVLSSNGRNALEVLMAAYSDQPFDLIISDVGMPDMNGHELLIAWRLFEKTQGALTIPALALTAYATSKDRTQALESGFQSHIPKPLDRNELIAVIESLGFGRG